MNKLLLLLLVVLLRVDVVRADNCDDDCASVSCLPDWWRSVKAPQLVVAAVLVFFATFLPRVLVRLLIFVLTKLPFMHQYGLLLYNTNYYYIFIVMGSGWVR